VRPGTAFVVNVGTITALKVKPRRPRLVEVYVDGQPALELSRPLAAELRVGQTVDAAALRTLESREAVESAVLRASRLLSRRPRSEHELRTALRRAGVDGGSVEAALERLRGAGEVDDLHFARAWVENRSDFRPRSAFALKAELLRKGVSRPAIDEALAGFSDEEAALAAARKILRRFEARESLPLDRQLYSYLQRRGFGHDTISAVVRRVVADPAFGMEREAEP
jgi:regulatory protein